MLGKSLVGWNAGGLVVGALDLRGVATSIGHVRVERMHGFAASAYNRIDIADGLMIGLVNWTESLRGVQIGLVNYVGDNPTGAKLLPIVNARF